MKQIVRAPSRTSSATSSAASLSALRRSCSASSITGGFHIAIWRRAPGEPSSSTRRTSSKPVRRSASSTGLAIVALASRKRGVVAVGGGDAPQPAQDVADVGAEHAAVDVRLVDHDDGEVGEEVRPRRVVGQDPDVQHVGVGEHEVRAPADGQALLALGVAVVDRGAHLLGQPEGVQRAGLVLGERLGRVEVERARLGVRAQDLERREVEAQRLAARRARGDDRRRLPRVLERLRLVAVELVDPGVGQALHDRRMQVGGELREDAARAPPRRPRGPDDRQNARPPAGRSTARSGG